MLDSRGNEQVNSKNGAVKWWKRIYTVRGSEKHLRELYNSIKIYFTYTQRIC